LALLFELVYRFVDQVVEPGAKLNDFSVVTGWMYAIGEKDGGKTSCWIAPD
jgi:hypothetical protein